MWKKVNAVTNEYKVFLINDIHIKAGVDGNPSATGAKDDALGRYYYAAPNNLRDFIRTANNEKPDLVLLLGDMCDIPSDWNLFNEIWSGLDDSIPRAATIGNHDFDVQTFPELLDILRYKGKTEIAGSKFNQAFSLNQYGFGVKFIMLDTTFNSSDNHGNHWQNVRAHTSSLAWLQNELETSSADTIFIGTHVGPHLADTQGFFDPTQKDQLKTIVDNAVTKNPNLKVTWLFGHHHLTYVEKYTNLGANNTGYLLPAVILDEPGRFTELIINKDTFTLNRRTLSYVLS